MDDVERFPNIVPVNNKRYIGLSRTLGTGFHADAASSEGTEQLAGNAGVMLHIFPDNSYSRQTIFALYRLNGACGDFLTERLLQDSTCRFGVLSAYPDGNAGLGCCL